MAVRKQYRRLHSYLTTGMNCKGIVLQTKTLSYCLVLNGVAYSTMDPFTLFLLFLMYYVHRWTRQDLLLYRSCCEGNSSIAAFMVKFSGAGMYCTIKVYQTTYWLMSREDLKLYFHLTSTSKLILNLNIKDYFIS